MATLDTSNDSHKLVDKPLLLGKIDDPVPVFFYQRREGSIFSCHENEAWTVHNFYTMFGLFIGRGDGKVYHAELVKLKAWQDEQIKKLHMTLRQSKAKIRRLERKAKLTKKEEKELDDLYDLEENFNDHVDKVIDQVKSGISNAWQMELENARGKMIGPRDQSFIGGGQRVGSDGKILSADEFRGLPGTGRIQT